MQQPSFIIERPILFFTILSTYVRYLRYVHRRVLVDDTGFILIAIPIIDENRDSQRVKSLKSIRQVQGFYNIGL